MSGLKDQEKRESTEESPESDSTANTNAVLLLGEDKCSPARVNNSNRVASIFIHQFSTREIEHYMSDLVRILRDLPPENDPDSTTSAAPST